MQLTDEQKERFELLRKRHGSRKITDASLAYAEVFSELLKFAKKLLGESFYRIEDRLYRSLIAAPYNHGNQAASILGFLKNIPSLIVGNTYRKKFVDITPTHLQQIDIAAFKLFLIQKSGEGDSGRFGADETENKFNAIAGRLKEAGEFIRAKEGQTSSAKQDSATAPVTAPPKVKPNPREQLIAVIREICERIDQNDPNAGLKKLIAHSPTAGVSSAFYKAGLNVGMKGLEDRLVSKPNFTGTILEDLPKILDQWTYDTAPVHPLSFGDARKFKTALAKIRLT